MGKLGPLEAASKPILIKEMHNKHGKQASNAADVAAYRITTLNSKNLLYKHV